MCFLCSLVLQNLFYTLLVPFSLPCIEALKCWCVSPMNLCTFLYSIKVILYFYVSAVSGCFAYRSIAGIHQILLQSSLHISSGLQFLCLQWSSLKDVKAMAVMMIAAIRTELGILLGY